MNRIKNLCVFCGSSPGINSIYRQTALELADYMVDNEIRMVNGGGSIGLMGVMADHMLARGGECYGVIPASLKEKEVAHQGMTKLHVVPDMHSRKLKMVNLADAFIALPGGYGTLDELFETLTWSQLHLHQKPIVLLNVDGFFKPLLDMADRMVEEGFLRGGARKLLQAASSVDVAVQVLNQAVPRTTLKWIHEPQQ